MGTDQGLLDKRKARRQMKTGLVLEGGAMRGDLYGRGSGCVSGKSDSFRRSDRSFCRGAPMAAPLCQARREEVSGIIKNTGMTNIL